jgi:hypothetical protein
MKLDDHLNGLGSVAALRNDEPMILRAKLRPDSGLIV